jgi:hypothetical protein
MVANMFFLSQLQPLAKYFREDIYFYKKNAIELALAQIVGAPDYQTARVRFTMVCEDLQIVLKFALEFLDPYAFKSIDELQDNSEYQLANPKLLVKSIIKEGSARGKHKELRLVFENPKRDESAADKIIREQQFEKIDAYVDLKKFTDSIAQLLGAGKNKDTPKSLDEHSLQCVNIQLLFQELLHFRRVLIVNESPTVEDVTLEPKLMEQFLKNHLQVMNTFQAIPDIISGLKYKLDEPQYNGVFSDYIPTYQSFRASQAVTDEVTNYVASLQQNFPNKKIFCVAGQPLKSDNHFHLIRDLILGYEQKLKYILAFESIKLKSKVINQKKINADKFNKQYTIAINNLKSALTLLQCTILPINYKTTLSSDTEQKVLTAITVISSELTVEELPKHDTLIINLVRSDCLVLAYAELSHQIESVCSYLKKANSSFKKIKLLSRKDIDTALHATDEQKTFLEAKYDAAIAELPPGNPPLKQLLNSVSDLLTNQFNPRYLRIVASVFNVKESDFTEIRRILLQIVKLKKEITAANKTVSDFIETVTRVKAKTTEAFSSNMHRFQLASAPLRQSMQELLVPSEAKFSLV